jgi:hypothetical protein
MAFIVAEYKPSSLFVLVHENPETATTATTFHLRAE